MLPLPGPRQPCLDSWELACQVGCQPPSLQTTAKLLTWGASLVHESIGLSAPAALAGERQEARWEACPPAIEIRRRQGPERGAFKMLPAQRATAQSCGLREIPFDGL